MTADEILQRLSPAGPYQKRLVFIVLLCAFANAWAPLSVIFTHYEPGHHCKVYSKQNETKDSCNNTLPWVIEDGIEVQSSCLMYSSNVITEDGECSTHETNQTIACSEWIFETEKDGGDTVVSEMGLVCDRDWIMPLILSIMMAGRAVGLMVSGAIADRFGRRPVFLVSSFLLFFTVIGMSLSHNIYLYGTFLSFSGAFSIIQYAVICVIGTEMVVPKYRNFMVLTLQCGYVIGYASLPLLAYFCQDWHVLLYIISAGSLVFVTGYWFVTSFVYYAITLNTSYLRGDRYINCLLSAVLEIPSIALAYWMLNKIGRVKTSFIFFLTSSLACATAPLLEQASPIATSVMAIAGKTAISGAFYVIYIHTVEIAPTLNRNLFMNICSAFSNIGSILSPYVMYIGKNLGSELAVYVPMGSLSAVAGILILFFLPETVGKPLPDTVQEAVEQRTLFKTICCRRSRKPEKRNENTTELHNNNNTKYRKHRSASSTEDNSVL